MFIWFSLVCLIGVWPDGDGTISGVVFYARWLVAFCVLWLSCGFRCLIEHLDHWCVGGFPLFLRQPFISLGWDLDVLIVVVIPWLWRSGAWGQSWCWR